MSLAKTKDRPIDADLLLSVHSTNLEESLGWKAKPTEWNQLWSSFDRYYADNEKVIMESAQLDIAAIGSSKKALKYEAAMTSFLEHSKTILHGLQFLSELHPAISVAVSAFAAVIKIELIRRDNNAKAMSVKIQMQNLMCALFQVRLLRAEQYDFTTGARMAHMMKIIAEEIKACGSDLSYYQDKKLISRLIHAQFFEQRLAMHIATFAERRSELNLLLTSYTAGRVHETAEIASRVEYKVDNLVNLLHRMDTSREKEATRFVEHNGGIENCIEHQDLLTELLGKTGDSIGHDNTDSEEDLKNLSKQLLGELRENIGEVLDKNMAKFDAMLRIQNNNMQHMSHLLENQTSQIMKISNDIAMAFPGMKRHVLLTDPILQKIWLEMGLRQSVKAKKFVLTFKDYHARMQPRSPTILATPDVHIVQLPPSSDLESSFLKPQGNSEAFTLGGDTERGTSDDDWALNYIDVVHLDPIVEAIDDDFSGFISIHEANRFAIGRPKTWSLLKWFAYWAAGWAVSVKRYKEKILDLVQQIYVSQLDTLPCNRAFVGDYLDSYAFRSLDTLLRSTQPQVGDYDITDGNLAALVADLDEKLEERLRSNLKDLKFNISSIDKVTLVTGPGRIERFAFPLIYLLLKHHLHIIRLSSQYRFCALEMYAPSTSLLMILNSLRSRTEKLQSIFRQKSKGIQDQFKKFSFGMFELFNSAESYAVKNNALLASHLGDASMLSSGSSDGDSDDEPESDHEGSNPKAGKVPKPDDEKRDNTVEDDAKVATPKSVLTPADLDALGTLTQDLNHDEDRPDCDTEQVIVNDFTRPPPEAITDSDVDILSGAWSGRMYRDRKLAVLQRDVIVFIFDPPSGPELTGKANSFLGPSTFTGTIRRGPREDIDAPSDGEGNENGILEIDLILGALTGTVYHFRASPVGPHTYDWKGIWSFVDHADKGERPFELLRAPPEGIRYRYILEDALVTSASGIKASKDSDPDIDTPEPHAEAETDPDIVHGPDLALKSNTLALARWKYAFEVVRFQVRQRMFSASLFKEAAHDRKRWLNAAMKWAHDEDSTVETCEILELRSRVHPNTSSIWERTKTFYLDRKVGEQVTTYVRCDYCTNQFCFVRHFCITCCLDSYNNQIDICEKCIDKSTPLTTDNFTHRPSHTLLKSRRRILNMEKGYLIDQARIRSKRVKQAFRGKNEHRHGSSQDAKKTEFRCGSCETELHLPCWVCTVCPQDTLLCFPCESAAKHDESHRLLRIFNDVDVDFQGTEDQAEKYFDQAKVMLAEEMKALEEKINVRMETLVTQIDAIHKSVALGRPSSGSLDEGDTILLTAENRDETLSERLGTLERNVNQRLASLEDVLQRILAAVEVGR